MQALETSIATDGWIGAITVAADGETFDGSARVEKTAENGMLDDPIVIESDGTRPVVVRRTDIPNATDPRAVRLGIAANRVASLNLEWEPDVLAGILAQGVDLGSLFTADEWADVTMPALPEAGAGGDEFDATPEDGPTRAQLGDLWIIGGKHRLLVGDCTDAANVARLMGDERADAVVTDPPYNVGKDFANDAMSDKAYKQFNQAWIACVPEKTGVMVAFHSPQKFPSTLDAARDEGWRFGRMLWLFKPGTAFGVVPWHGWARRSECILVFERNAMWPDWVGYHADLYEHVKGSGGTEESFDGQFGDEVMHPTLKPLWVVEDIVKHTTGDIYDPFLGSGTTLIAAHRTGRRCYGMEIAPRYCDVILRRAEAEGLTVERADG